MYFVFSFFNFLRTNCDAFIGFCFEKIFQFIEIFGQFSHFHIHKTFSISRSPNSSFNLSFSSLRAIYSENFDLQVLQQQTFIFIKFKLTNQ